jgi:hypothetical protein
LLFLSNYDIATGAGHGRNPKFQRPINLFFQAFFVCLHQPFSHSSQMIFFNYICNESKALKVAMKTSLIDNILYPPEAPPLVDEVQKVLMLEKEKREQFYQKITDQEKAKFTNGEMILHSPSTMKHGDIFNQLSGIMQAYVKKNNLGWVEWKNDDQTYS